MRSTCVFLLATGAHAFSTKPPSCKTIAELVTETDALSTLLAAVGAADAGILAALSDPDATLTVFAPTVDAFAALPEGALDNLLLSENQAVLTSILQKHVLASVVPEAAALGLQNAAVVTLNGEEITVDGSTGAVLVTPTIVGGPATVVLADIEACNGVVHVVDAVLAVA